MTIILNDLTYRNQFNHVVKSVKSFEYIELFLKILSIIQFSSVFTDNLRIFKQISIYFITTSSQLLWQIRIAYHNIKFFANISINNGNCWFIAGRDYAGIISVRNQQCQQCIVHRIFHCYYQTMNSSIATVSKCLNHAFLNLFLKVYIFQNPITQYYTTLYTILLLNISKQCTITEHNIITKWHQL